MKVCTVCGGEKDSVDFGNCKSSKDGKKPQCKSCRSKSARVYSKNNAKACRRRAKEYRLANLETVKARESEYRKKNRSTELARERARRAKDPEKYKAKNKEYYDRNPEYHKERSRIYVENNRDVVNARSKASRGRPTKSKSWAGSDKLPECYDSQLFDGVVTVVCKYCGIRFIPTLGAVRECSSHYLGSASSGGECNMYCSDKCKGDCITFNQKKYPRGFKPHQRELQDAWAKVVKERDGYKCQRCGSKENLHAHHILPIATEYDAWHIDNGITFCVECHYGYAHKLQSCSLNELRESC